MSFASSFLVFSVFCGALAYAGVLVRRAYFKLWTGLDGALVICVVFLSLGALVTYVLGAAGLLYPVPLTLVAVAVCVGVWLAGGRKGMAGVGESAKLVRSPSFYVALAGLALLLWVWFSGVLVAEADGLTDTDPLWYQMPLAAQFFHDHSLLGTSFVEPLFGTHYFPAVSGAIPHALGMVFFDTDWLSPLINLGWVGLALLAAASIGGRYRAALEGFLGCAILLATPAMVGGEAGSAKTDAASLALFLAAVALLLRAERDRDFGLAGAAAGLAVAVKLTVAFPAVGLAAAVAWLARPGRRLRTLAVFAAPAAVFGGFWFLRNIYRYGSPQPGEGIPLFQRAPLPWLQGHTSSIAHYLVTDPSPLLSQWHIAAPRLGDYWLGILTMGAIGIAAGSLVRLRHGGRLLALLALWCVPAYLLTPFTAFGTIENLVGLSNIRLGAAAIALGLICFGIVSHSVLRGRARWVGVGLMFALLAGTVLTNRTLTTLGQEWPAGLLAVGVVAGVIGFVALQLRFRPGVVSVVAASLLFGTVLAGANALSSHYFDARTAAYGQTLITQKQVRIGLVGSSTHFGRYMLYGTHQQNQVEIVGERLPHGGFREPSGCAALKRLINRGNYDYLYVSGNRDIWHLKVLPSADRAYLAGDPGARLVKYLKRPKANASISVFKIERPLDVALCRPYR
ncbi:MAG: DUF2029 domain-containing protein [Actinobacteria bacterium]|uniref:Unannotated protein n=1 Tax=freshwater metagenome TaxID=449393 RepID=A0A6J7EKV1_9ZZZZ|nr:DUF2029 domain-containing protein [Actinomycetota bacterium]